MEPDQVVRDWLPHCPLCGTERVDVKWENDTLLYGVDNPIELTVVVPVETCTVCQIGYTGWRAEEIRDATVDHYLKTGKLSLDI
jgi:hypothetical protein